MSIVRSIVRSRLDEFAHLDGDSPAVIVVGPVAAFDLGSSTRVTDRVTSS